jgi:nicastrin
MLAALHALHASATSSSSASSAGFSSYSKRIVFMALAGEPWGYMGSRRLLYEAASGSNNTAGLNMSLVEQVGRNLLVSYVQLLLAFRAIA